LLRYDKYDKRDLCIEKRPVKETCKTDPLTAYSAVLLRYDKYDKRDLYIEKRPVKETCKTDPLAA